MADLFKEILPSIMERKKDVLENVKDYNAFIVNRALSYHSDCLFDANEMNQRSGLDKRLQYLFYMHSLRAARRPFQKWGKAVKSNDLEAVKLYFDYGNTEAIAALGVFTEAQLVIIREKVRIE